MQSVDQLKRDGYIIIRDIFTRDSIEVLRAKIREIFEHTGTYKYGGKYKLHAMHESAEVARLIFSSTFVKAIKECTYPHSCLLTGECDLHIDILSNWHKDVKEAWAKKTSVHSDPAWGVYKAAIYLQDQDEKCAGAFKVRPGSHLLRLGEATEVKALPVRAGDVVIFDVRIDHMGRNASLGSRMLRWGLTLVGRCLEVDHEMPFAVARARLARFAGSMPQRMAAYLTFGPNLPCTYDYEEMGRADHGAVPNALDAAVLAKLANDHIQIIHPQVMAS